ncbi:hypothetical protein [Gemelliphila palaticanis]|uniref:Dolichyl-phosphate-mannose-protein mannosyltransferase n=1 Tax=Gemelliphila palaticanis TaxID=81950 RepID=A0ABX2T2W7_9BACL|nr:hypothetical protein [Gemella palaticanis]MBF0715630.1 hypothetical protein [Gemella palaticanis]NYS47560.1 hypothetical protein [Gemella palaticanis]
MNRNIVSKILTVIVGLIFFALMSINSTLVMTKTAIFPSNYQETLYYKNDNIILNAIYLIAFSIFILFISKYLMQKINIKRLVLISMIYVFILSLIFAILRRDYVQFDPFNVIDQASNFIRNNYTGLDKGENYLYIYSHQITTVFMFQIILSLFGRATFILYLMQCFSISYILFMLYKISDIIFEDEEVNYLVVVISLLCFPLIFYVAFVYGLLPGMFLVLLSFYHFIKYSKTKKWYHLVIVTFSMNIAILFIGNNLIHLLAIISVSILLLIIKFDKKILLFMLTTFSVMILFKSLIFNYYEYKSQRTIPDGVDKITWVAMGMQEGDREAGWWNSFNYDILIESDYNNEVVKDISKKSIEQRLNVFKNNKSYAYDFYKRKYENQFIEPTFQSLLITAPQKDMDNETTLIAVKNSILKELYFGNVNSLLFNIMKAFQIYVYIFSLLFSIIIIKEKKIFYLLIPISFIGGTLFHMIWEAKSRYIFPYFIFLIPISAYSLIYIKNIIFRKYINKEVKSNDK